ncbi:MAG: DUF4129 domain-containing protein [Candidatus Thermoplasmatota archaeon]|nr:DUF4129 domain-containing protein [Euryarchaeota archaeon]MBU4031761.1 DUF4129 domain-containing protein [Candidatus Thermoplasmatota archaeon]MBU4072118.1 DUF4129 domain-containing protein [Candidatus Thermoplasmatota archaeon]MBU4144995.1 DUF4129 domain-containing protein [Candidatus Thermoplasmatota archaeon]MBU4592009.1 DUF4129 domain-containing protein [Candidatus Thermoplasmatota archaeon]
MNRQTYEKLAVAILLMAFVFVLGNLVFNLENLFIGEDNIPEFIPGSEQAQDIATNDTLAHAIRWIYYGFLGFCIVMVLIGAVSFTASKDRKKWRKMFYQMVSVLLIIGVIFAFGYFYDDIESSVMGGGSTDILPGGGGNASTGNGTALPPESPDTLKVVLTFGLFAIIFLFCIVAVMGFVNILRMRSTNLDYSDIEKDKQEVAQTIQRTIDALAGGSDTRATVIRCYTDMCKVISKYGVKEEEHLTPREFQKLALDNLPVPEEQMRALVDVFEEARYSHHNMDEQDSARAVKALEAVRKNLLVVKKPSVQEAE